MSDPKQSFPPDMFPIPATDLVDEPGTFEIHNRNEPADLQDLLLRIERMEAQLDARSREKGSGVLNVLALPFEDASEATPRMVWLVPGPLTCQTSKGRNLQFVNFALQVWNDGRIRLNGPFYNTSKHTNWDVTIAITVWYRSGHATRPLASASRWFGEIRNGHVRQIDDRFYSNELASLYDSYRAGELYLRFGLYAERTN